MSNSQRTTYPSVGGQIFDCPIWQAVEYVRQVIGKNGAGPLLPLTKVAIRQAALDSRIAIFGKKELPSPKPPGYCSEVWTLIPSEYWQTNELGPLAAEEEWEEHEHTRGEPLVVDGYRERYWALLVNRDELIATFPAPEHLRPSHAAVVDWCRQWIKSGKGNGMDKAWKAFNAKTEHRGLSRDDVFRPAWREAKTR